ncbi:ADP-ribosylation factor-like protein 3 [[Candida] railenensis]|uniref:ADP-ribosylation factor-like protein 3 n=1 Tax=[Candida] railenensis TaxID=45579 RepID=A0A9P0QKM3_9ASCO|nr:ADP-ribosylation factor-like protein 3 [[Candida] railenensis]
MFHLASSLYTQYTKREQYNVLILGLDNAGKTTFLEHVKLLYSSPESSKHAPINEAHASEANNATSKALKSKRILPTVGQNTTTVKYEAARESTLSKSYNNINLKFWDLGGQQSLRSMWSRYYRQCHGIIFVIDSTDTARFQECYDTLMEISHNPSWAATEEDGESSTASEAQEHLMSQQDEATVNVPILMMANKQDLPEAVDLVSLKTGVFIQVVSELEATDSKLLPVSVLENQGLKESLEWLVTRLVYNKSNKMPEYR